MADLFKKAFLSIFLDKKGREGLELRQKIRAAEIAAGITPSSLSTPPAPNASPTLVQSLARGVVRTLAPIAQIPLGTIPPPPRTPTAAEAVAWAVDQAEAQLQEQKRASQLTPERQELIRNALKVRAEKQEILNQLDPGTRDRLQAMALKAMMGVGAETTPPAKKPPAKKPKER